MRLQRCILRNSGEWLFGRSWCPFPSLSCGEVGLAGEQDQCLRLPPGMDGFAGGAELSQDGRAGRTVILSKKKQRRTAS